MDNQQTTKLGAKALWFRLLREASDPYPMLRSFAPHYHYFSMHQIMAFSRIFTHLSPMQRETLALIAKTIHEEFGNGNLQRIHSLLFERFAASIGIDIAMLPLPREHVLEGVRAYVDALYEGFDTRSSLPKALATYVFLEKTAVEIYPPLLAALQQCSLSDDAIEFFTEHAVLEPHHLETANALVISNGISQEEDSDFARQMAHLEEKYGMFWDSMLRAAYVALQNVSAELREKTWANDRERVDAEACGMLQGL